MSVFAKLAYDNYLAVGMAYDAHSPRSSVGAGLDSVVAINGIKRKAGAHSVAEVTLTGSPSLYIPRGFVGDFNGHIWDLPGGVTLGGDGTATVTATARESGNIIALAGEITRIMTPVLGWNSVTNTAASTAGTLVETDTQLRARQKISVALPSQSMLASMAAEISNINNVTRFAWDENDTNQDNANGVPAHCVCFIVEGGDDEDIARAIYLSKSPGCGTYGSAAVNIIDAYGRTNAIRFSRPAYVDIDVAVTIKAFPTYTPDAADGVKGAIADYLTALEIGDDLVTSVLWREAQRISPETREPSFAVISVTAARRGEPLSENNIPIAYDEAARGNLNYVTVMVA
ncbi:MAG: baseplate J/gp47 family protein [Oscillospiraceae bacterium]|jgi:uncharacterized phage protein gp47/JayE|nr:baseplate J/gp47 family protein [Oscillospiraceae bacterium]